MIELDTLFAGSIPGLYDTYLVPLIFEPYADDIADRLKSRSVSRVLEVACGTGVATRALATALNDDVEIVANFGAGEVEGKIQAHIVTIEA